MVTPGEYISTTTVVICCAECERHEFLICGDDIESDLRNGDYRWYKSEPSGKWVCLSCLSYLNKLAKEKRAELNG